MLRPALLGLALLLPAALASCGSGGSASSCVAVVEVDGVSYYGEDEPEGKVPVTGEVVDAVIPGCNDTGSWRDEPDEEVRAEVIEGVPTDVAVLYADTLHVREGARLPAAAAAWYASASCTRSGELRLAGRWVGVSEPAAPYFDGVLDPPYDVVVQVDDGPRRHVGSTLEVQVTEETDPVLARSDLPRLDVARLQAQVTCRDGGFVASSVRLNR